MKAVVYNQKKEKVSEITLPKEIFEVALSQDLVWQVAMAQSSAKRRNIAKTKTREEVSGGGKKPWRQKGTGRARHGSSRSPIWKGGGVTFGPVSEKNYLRETTKKMRRNALFMVLSEKAKGEFISIIDDFNFEKPQTKNVAIILDKFFPEKGKILLALPQKSENAFKSARNIKRAKVVPAKELNVLELLSHKYLFMPEASVKEIKETFLKDN
jgi:large subunit ribosomal protein L4